MKFRAVDFLILIMRWLMFMIIWKKSILIVDVNDKCLDLIKIFNVND